MVLLPSIPYVNLTRSCGGTAERIVSAFLRGPTTWWHSLSIYNGGFTVKKPAGGDAMVIRIRVMYFTQHLPFGDSHLAEKIPRPSFQCCGVDAGIIGRNSCYN